RWRLRLRPVPVRAGSEGAASRQEPGGRGADAAPGPGDRHYPFRRLPVSGLAYSSSLASACSHTARLPHGQVSGRHPHGVIELRHGWVGGRHPDGVIELRLPPPGFTELGFTGFDLMPSRDQIRAVAQDVVAALRAPAQRPRPRRWPDGAPATLRPGPWPHPATAISPADQAPEAARAASWPERPVRPYTDRREVPVKAPRSRQQAPPADPANHPDGVKTSHPASRKAAHGPNGYHDQPAGDRGARRAPVTSRRRRP